MDASRFRDFLLVDRRMAPITVDGYVRYLERATRRGLDLGLFLSSPQACQAEGRRFLSQVRQRDSVNAYNGYQRVLNAAAKYAGHDVHFQKLPEPLGQPRTFADWEIQRLLQYRCPGDREAELRRRALVWWALFSGCRHSEIWRLGMAEVDFQTGRFWVQSPAKGGRRRRLRLEREVLSAHRPMMAWVHRRPITPADPGTIWTTTRRGGRVAPVSYSGLYKELRSVGQAVGVSANFFRTRHWRGTTLGKRLKNLRLVQLYLGHARIETTARYVDLTEQDLDEAMAQPAESPFAKRRATSES